MKISSHAKKAGFTLIELIVVIGIIGILAAAALPTYTSFFAKAGDNRRQQNVRTVSVLIKGDDFTSLSRQYLYRFASSDSDKRLEDTFKNNDFELADDDECYFYGVQQNTQTGVNEFFVATANEKRTEWIVDGTIGGKDAMKSVPVACDSDPSTGDYFVKRISRR